MPIYLDGLVRQVTDVLSENLIHLPESLQNLAQNLGHSPFYREQVVKVSSNRQRQEIINSPHPSIILASSGMLSGGVSPLYARKILGESESALFLVGYQDAESPGRRLLELERGGEVMLPSNEGFEPVTALCYVSRYYLSAHADRIGILAHLSRHPSPRVYLMHGEGGARESLMATLKKDYFVKPIRNEMWVDLLEEITIPRLLEKQAGNGGNHTNIAAPLDQSGKIKRFRTDIDIVYRDDEVLLQLPEGIDVKGVIPEGRYRLTMTKSSFTRLELRELLESQAQESGQEEVDE
ncbi:MAG: hypothetical protein R2880_04560 [Deinococcales bacterium]